MRSEVTSTANGTRVRDRKSCIVPTLTSVIQEAFFPFERFEFLLSYVAYPTLEQLGQWVERLLLALHGASSVRPSISGGSFFVTFQHRSCVSQVLGLVQGVHVDAWG
jgi:hypothetical protein